MTPYPVRDLKASLSAVVGRSQVAELLVQSSVANQIHSHAQLVADSLRDLQALSEGNHRLLVLPAGLVDAAEAVQHETHALLVADSLRDLQALSEGSHRLLVLPAGKVDDSEVVQRD